MQTPADDLGDEEEELADEGQAGGTGGSDQMAGGDEKLQFFRREDEREMQGTILVEKERNLAMEKDSMEQPPKLGFLGASSSSNNGGRVTAPAFHIDEFLRLANKVVDEGDTDSMAALEVLKNRWEARFGHGGSYRFQAPSLRGGFQGIPRATIKARRGILKPAIDKTGENDVDLTGVTFGLPPATPEIQAGDSGRQGCEDTIPTRGVEVSSSTYSPLKDTPLVTKSIEETSRLPPLSTGDLGLLAGRTTTLEHETGRPESSQQAATTVLLNNEFPPVNEMNSPGKMVAGPSVNDMAPISEVAHTFCDVEDDVDTFSADEMAEDEMAQVMVGIPEDISNTRAYVSSTRAEVSSASAEVSSDAAADVSNDVVKKQPHFQTIVQMGLYVGNIPLHACPEPIIDDKIAHAFNHSSRKTLSHVALTLQNGEVIVRPTLDAIRNGAKRWKATAVGYFLGKRPYFHHLKEYAVSVWPGLREVTGTTNGFFFFQFKSIAAMEDII
ncbi:UNVERIFIED_CONTAM: hypothetical protein Sindi_2874200 [Sesamum indicum]